MNPKVSIIILNWNGWEDTLECLESLYQITYPNYDVIVVDNGSEDESIEKIKEYAEGKIEVESKFFEYDPSNKPIKIIEYIRKEAYNIGGGTEKTNIEIANVILEGLNKPKSLIKFVKDRPGHDFRYSLGTTKIQGLRWTPRYKFEDAMKETIRWYKENEWWWKTLRL